MKKINLIAPVILLGTLLCCRNLCAQPSVTEDSPNTLTIYSNQNNLMKKTESKTIVFITGAFVSNACWNDWRIYFESKGYTTIAPAWPGKEGDPAMLRSRQPDRKLSDVSMPELVTYYSEIIARLPEKPILIGHSFGGLLAQVLMNKGLAAECVAIHAVPPQGVLPYELNFFRSNTKALGFFTSIHKTYLISFKKWQFVFTNGMPLEAQQKGYNALAIPESKRAIRGGLTKTAHVDFKKDHVPLLIIGGEQDQCIPAHLVKRVFKRYQKNKNSVTELVIKDRNHFVLGLPTWKEDADYIINWLKNH